MLAPMTTTSCPEGMYPLDSHHDTNRCADFAELKDWAERQSDALNLPLSWYIYDEDSEGWEDDAEPRNFTLVFHMPRKHSNWSLTTAVFNRAEVQEWLDTWLRGEINTWFGWTES
jgi:hypothetical protein